MVTQAPKRSAVLAAVAFTLSCVGLMVFVWTQFGGTIPFAAQGYRVKALFSETGLLVPKADVRISGVTIGRVTAVEARGVNSLVTMDIQRKYAPIPRDTLAILRQKTLLGEAYVMLSTGNPHGPGGTFNDGETIPNSHVEKTQQLDQVLGSFDKPTQKNLQALLTNSFTAIAGRGQDLNNAVGNFGPALDELAAMVQVLNRQQGNVRRLINDTGTVLTTLGDRSADLQSLVTAGDQVLSATAARDAQLTATINALPPFLSQLRTTLTTLNTTLAITKPTLATLRPVAPLLTPALQQVIKLSTPAIKLLREAPSLLNAATKALPAITRFTSAFKPAVDVLLPAAREVTPMINFISLYSKELVAAMANFSSTLIFKSPANTTQDVGGIPAGQAVTPAVLPPLNNEVIFGQTTREPTNRHNGYYSPGEQSNVAGGLFTSDCANTSDASQVPVPGTNVPCKVQPGFPWGTVAPTTPNNYFPHLTRAPLPK
jgi:virulence factor Mce-like protein